MNPLLDIVRRASRRWFPEVTFGGLATPWLDPSPIRAEIFGPERLAHHALSLADRPKRVLNLTVRLRQNADMLLAAYR